MVTLDDERLRRLCAWPGGLLLDDRSGRTAGFLMPRVDGKELHLAYAVSSRRRYFPDLDSRFPVRVAGNLAAAFAILHEKGHVFGDVNEKLSVVDGAARVTLVDCDSFQVRHDGRLYPCDVGVPTHQPPELQGVSLRGRERSPDHDSFGLAVCIFQCLFLAKHPFAGRPLDGRSLAPNDAIREHRFAYGRLAPAYRVAPPPNSFRLADLTPRIGHLFERAFSPEADRSGRPGGREWVDALREYLGEVRPCEWNGAHYYLKTRPTCPFCALESGSGVSLFAPPATASPSAAKLPDPGQLWLAIESVAPAGPAGAPPRPQ